MFVLPPQVNMALERLSRAGYEAYLVGGCVRDLLLGHTPKDFDITTSAMPEEMMTVFAGERVIETGLKHGTLTVLSDGMPLEITTYRIDAEYTDHRHPDRVIFTRSLREDLARRDFTVNAMAYHPRVGLVDVFGGQQDLKAGLIRCVGEADRRFREDALRIMRGLRFSSVLGFEIEQSTADSILKNKDLLSNVSAERIAVELKKLLCGQNVKEILLLFHEVLECILPELSGMQGFDQKSPYHCYDLLTHTVLAVAHIEAVPALRLAALLHDAGKLDCFTVDEWGIGHCYKHSAISAEKAEAACRRLKLDHATQTRVVQLVKHHDMQVEPTEVSVKRALHKLTPQGFFDLLAMKRADTAGQGPALQERNRIYDRLEELAHRLLEQKACFSLKELAVGGDDLIALGIQPGKGLGEILKTLLNAVMEGEVPNEREALLAFWRSKI